MYDSSQGSNPGHGVHQTEMQNLWTRIEKGLESVSQGRKEWRIPKRCFVPLSSTSNAGEGFEWPEKVFEEGESVPRLGARVLVDMDHDDVFAMAALQDVL